MRNTYDKLSAYISPSVDLLPEPVLKQSALFHNASSSSSSFIQEMLAKAGSAESEMAKTLKALGDEYCADPSSQLAKWEGAYALREMFGRICELPVEAATGHLRIKGLMPKAIDRPAAQKFVALVLLSATRVMFLAERNGLVNFKSAVEARGFRYGLFLSPDEQVLIEGFRPFCRLFDSPNLTAAFHGFTSRLWTAFPREARPFMSLAVTHELLLSVGRAGRTRGGEV